MGSVLETDKICSFNVIKSLNNKHGDGLPGQGVPGHDPGFEGKDGGLLGSPLPRHEPLGVYLKELVNKPLTAIWPDAENQQGVQQPAGGHSSQGCHQDEEKVTEAVEDRRRSI